jgi:hypothetical protein
MDVFFGFYCIQEDSAGKWALGVEGQRLATCDWRLAVRNSIFIPS